MNDNQDTLTVEDFQRTAAKGDKLSGDLAALMRSADLGGWAATLSLQTKRELTGNADPEVTRVAIREILWHLASIATKLNVPLQDVANEALGVNRG